MIRGLLVALAGFAAGQAVAAQSVQVTDAPMLSAEVLQLRGLDTLRGSAEDIRVRVGETVRFGHLEITADGCRVPRPTRRAMPSPFCASATSARWSRASPAGCSLFPGALALDHPRYDVWVLRCGNG